MNSKISKELRRIMRSIPLELQEGLVKKVPTAPVINELYEKVKADPDADPEAVRKLELFKKAGYMDKTVEEVDQDIVKQIDAYLEDQIERAIKLGRLPAKDSEEYKKYANNYGKLTKQISQLEDETSLGEEHQTGDSQEPDND